MAVKRGRQSKFTQELAGRICDEMANGASLRKVCEAEDMPTESTVRRWAIDDEQGFASQYTRARELQAHKLAEEILEIANTPVMGQKSVSKATGLEITEGDMIEHRRLQVDARKWYLSKVLPKIYGDKLELAGNSESPLTVVVKKLSNGN